VRADRIGEGSPSQPRASRHYVAADLRHLDHRVASRDPGSVVSPGADQVPETLRRVGAMSDLGLVLTIAGTVGVGVGAMLFYVLTRFP
jgi:hypothetical protein